MLLAALRNFCLQYGVDKTYWIAYSGGLDSHVLLHLFHSLRTHFPLKLRVIHVNHGLSVHANQWAQHCASLCHDYQIDYHEELMTLQVNPGESLEEMAREKRYQLLASYLNVGDILLTAHHQDDQAETLLLQLLRGAGLKGLAAMPLIKPCAQGLHARPLLGYSRQELAAYAHQHHLQWIDDESNSNAKFTRNFIRQEILTLLQQRWPAVTTTIARSARHCAEAQMLLDEFAIEICDEMRGKTKNTLSVSKLMQVNSNRQRLILRTWIHLLGYPLPGTKKLIAMQEQLLMAACDRMPCVRWQKIEVRRYQDDIYLFAQLTPHDAQQKRAWNLQQPLLFPGIGILQANYQQGETLLPDVKNLSVRFRQGGESIHVASRGRRTLKNLFHEWQVPPWMRDRIPLLFLEDKLIGVVGYLLDAEYMTKTHEYGWCVKLISENP